MNPEIWPPNNGFDKNPKRYFLNPCFGRSHILGTEFPTFVKSLEHGLRWTSLLINYTKRSLTVQTDRLIGISGLAQEIQAQSGYTYCAGIWAEDVHLELSWKMHGLGQTSETYIAPSWSWAALKFRAETNLHAIYYLEAEIDESKFRAEILGCEVVTMDGGPYGSVSSGRLRLRSLWLGLKQ